MVFIAGCGADPICWALARRSLEANFRVLTFDNRMVTASGAGGLTTEDLADAAAGLLEHLGIEQALVVGHSLGGMVAQQLSLRHPQRVRALALVGSSARLSERANHVLQSLHRALALDPWLYLELLLPWAFSAAFFRSAKNLHFIRESFQPPPLEGFKAHMEAVASHDSRQLLGKISVPTLVVAGEEDLLCDSSDAIALSEGIRNSRVEIMPGGHAGYMEYANEFHEILRRFSSSSSLRLGVRQS